MKGSLHTVITVLLYCWKAFCKRWCTQLNDFMMRMWWARCQDKYREIGENIYLSSLICVSVLLSEFLELPFYCYLIRSVKTCIGVLKEPKAFFFTVLELRLKQKVVLDLNKCIFKNWRAELIKSLLFHTEDFGVTRDWRLFLLSRGLEEWLGIAL